MPPHVLPVRPAFPQESMIFRSADDGARFLESMGLCPCETGACQRTPVANSDVFPRASHECDEQFDTLASQGRPVPSIAFGCAMFSRSQLEGDSPGRDRTPRRRKSDERQFRDGMIPEDRYVVRIVN